LFFVASIQPNELLLNLLIEQHCDVVSNSGYALLFLRYVQ